MAPIISSGFGRRRRDDAPRDRVPPGQYATRSFPVLSAGPTPHTPLERLDFAIVGVAVRGDTGNRRATEIRL